MTIPSTGPQLNLSWLYQILPNREQVALYDKFGNLLATVADAKRLMQDVKERELSFGEYLETYVDWVIPQQEAAFEILMGTNIIDQFGIPYTVLEADPPSTYGLPHRCYCRRVRVLGLLNKVDWRIVNNETDVYGDRLTDPTMFALGAAAVPARIQPADPLNADIVDILGKRGEMLHYLIYVLTDWNLQFGDLIIDTDNNNQAYKVVAWKSRQDLACSMVIIAEILPGNVQPSAE